MKKILFAILLIIFLPAVMMGQEYTPFQKRGKWGIEKGGNIVVKPQYYDMKPFGENFIVRGKQGFTLLSPNGKQMTEFYSTIKAIRRDRAIAGGTVLIEADGKKLSEDFQSLDTISITKESVPFLLVRRWNQYGLIDYDGNIVLPPTYPSPFASCVIKTFGQNLIIREKRGWVLLSPNGKQLLPNTILPSTLSRKTEPLSTESCS